MHKYDPKTYSVVCFSHTGRRVGERLRGNFQSSRKLSARWKRLTGGTAVIMLCLSNNALTRETMPENSQ